MSLGDTSSEIEELVTDHLGRQRTTLGGLAPPGFSQSTEKVFIYKNIIFLIGKIF